jgi:hypothetical protein
MILGLEVMKTLRGKVCAAFSAADPGVRVAGTPTKKMDHNENNRMPNKEPQPNVDHGPQADSNIKVTRTTFFAVIVERTSKAMQRIVYPEQAYLI